jgi:hypothetical protein
LTSRRRYLLPALAGLAVLFISAAILVPAHADGANAPPAAPPAEAPAQGISNETCLKCHGQPGVTMTLGDGEVVDLYVDPATYNASIHGQGGYACVQCHTTVGNYPHPAFQAADRRDLTLQLYPACQRCHSGQYKKTLDSVHERARQAGIREAAVCSDCHTAHATRRLTDPDTHQLLPDARTWIPTTCAQCHNAIYQKYLTSVHGAALTQQGNLDVPTCIDCHGVHNIEDPTTAAFRLKSPNLCAKCHTDPARMSKYGISTQVLSTYVADFHGTTVTLFEKESPDAETNKPVCFDCHGVHDIQRVDDPRLGLEIKANLLARCQRCHPDATANFPTAWLSHYIPSPDKAPLVYYVNLFYKFFIPGVLGGMAVLVVLDASSLIRGRTGRPPTKPAAEAPAEIQPAPPEPPQPPTEAEAQTPAQAQPPPPSTEAEAGAAGEVAPEEKEQPHSSESDEAADG